MPLILTYRGSFLFSQSLLPQQVIEKPLMRLFVTSNEGYKYAVGDRTDPGVGVLTLLPPSWSARMEFAVSVAVTAHGPFVVTAEDNSFFVTLPDLPRDAAFLPAPLPTKPVTLNGVTYTAVADQTSPPNESTFNTRVTAGPGRSWMRVVITATNTGGYRAYGNVEPAIFSKAGYAHVFEWDGPVGDLVSRERAGRGTCCGTVPGETKSWAYYFALTSQETPIAIAIVVVEQQEIGFGVWPLK